MKTVLYFILAILTIIYIGFLCYVNLIGIETMSMILNYIAIYGGLGIALLYAAINFFGSPLKIVFFILLIIMTIFLVLTIAIPDVFRKLFNLSKNAQELISPFLNK